MDNIEKYLAKTNQTFQYLMSGSMQHGEDFITNILVEEALNEGKKIVWTKHLVDGKEVGLLNYELQPI